MKILKAHTIREAEQIVKNQEGKEERKKERKN